MPVNELELRVYGLMRSGNHAVIEWILGLFPGQRGCFLNNVRHGDLDPWASAHSAVLQGFGDGWEQERCRLAPKKLLIYSYEDRKVLKKTGKTLLQSVFDPAFEDNRESYLGDSDRRRDVLILRDPFNCFASRLTLLRQKGHKGGVNKMSLVVQNWKLLARRALEIQQGGDDERMVILFNRWSENRAYRRHIARTLGGRYSENSMAQVATYGGGSSFQLGGAPRPSLRALLRRPWLLLTATTWRKWRRYLESRLMPRRYRARQLAARWQRLRRKPAYRRLFRDPEILQLSEALFGEIPGTRDFVRKVSKERTAP